MESTGSACTTLQFRKLDGDEGERSTSDREQTISIPETITASTKELSKGGASVGNRPVEHADANYDE